MMASGSMSPAPAPAPRRDDPPCGGGGDGGVTGGGLNRPSEPSGSKTPSWHECGDRLVTSSKSSLTPAPEPPRCTDLDDSPMSGVDEFEGGGGVDEVSKKLRLKSDVVSKVTSVVTLLASVGPEPSAPRD